MLQVKGTLSNVPATGDYAGLKNKPQINGAELVGNKTTDELGTCHEGTGGDLTENDRRID